MSLHLDNFKPTEKEVEASLLPPEVAREYMNPVEDDTWVRHADLVHVEELRAVNADDVAAKRALLQGYASSAGGPSTSASATKATTGHLSTSNNPHTSEAAAIMEGMAWQEKFLTDYKKQNGFEDKGKALGYKQKMMENFRKKHGTAAPPDSEM